MGMGAVKLVDVLLIIGALAVWLLFLYRVLVSPLQLLHDMPEMEGCVSGAYALWGALWGLLIGIHIPRRGKKQGPGGR